MASKVDNESPALNEAPLPVRNLTASARNDVFQLAQDFFASFRSSGYWLYSAWIDILLGYRSAVLGPLWIMLGTGVFVFVVGNLYGRVFIAGDSNIYIAYLAVGLVVWYFTQRTLLASCRLFHDNRGPILDGAVSYTDMLLKLITKNIITLLHNVVIIIIAFVYTGLGISAASLAVILTSILVLLNVVWVSVIFSILGARNQDFREAAAMVLRLMFFITPILWVAHQNTRGPFVEAILYWNPIYYLITVIRTPLIDGQIPLFEIAVLLFALPIGWLAASLIYTRTKSSIPLWL
jgi:ABC-type polysaccharide/polyol phosphate export permease